jgi:hypothetical protein
VGRLAPLIAIKLAQMLVMIHAYIHMRDALSWTLPATPRSVSHPCFPSSIPHAPTCIPHMHVCVCVCGCGWNEVFLCVCVLMYVCVYGRRLNTQCGLQGARARPKPWRNVLRAARH